MSRIILVGLPGVGKTAVAVALAERWGGVALDTDDLVSSAVGMPAAAYLRREGEAAFRDREVDVLRKALHGGATTVIATGGGIVCSPRAREALAQAFTIWLDCDDDVILSRLGDVDRPLLARDPSETLARLRREREGWYAEVSRARIDASAPVLDVLDAITREVDKLSR